ncbi:MAG TPA: hypothetical protein PKE45_08915 [Caldilineaceae bacterium]|nr:hypothetical protein [Caldilineaceae bacterium]
MRPVVKNPARLLFHETYDVLRRELINVIGSYCCYCEAPIGVDVPVEHKAPKSNKRGNYTVGATVFNHERLGFPDYATQWRNLVPACNSCNSVKGDRPTTEDAREFLNATGGNLNPVPPGKPPRPVQPALPGDETDRLFTFEYVPRSQAYWVAQNLRRTMQANEANQPWAQNNQTMLWVIPNQAYINGQPNSAQLLQRVKGTVAMLGLNNYHTGDPRVSDRRAENRTRVYQNALAAAQALANVVQQAGGIVDGGGALRPAVQLMMQSIRQAALAQGFFSVWAFVFRGQMQAPGPSVWSVANPNDVRRVFQGLFVQYLPGERALNASQLIFPGTDLARIAW